MDVRKTGSVAESESDASGKLFWFCIATIIWLAALALALAGGSGWLAAVVGIHGFLFVIPEGFSVLGTWHSCRHEERSQSIFRAALRYRGNALWLVYIEAGQLALVVCFVMLA